MKPAEPVGAGAFLVLGFASATTRRAGHICWATELTESPYAAAVASKGVIGCVLFKHSAV